MEDDLIPVFQARNKGAASKPRLDPDKLPFNPRNAIMQVPEWDNLDSGWGVGY